MLLNPKESLFPLAKISKVFFNFPNKNHLHVVISPPPTSELSVKTVIISSTTDHHPVWFWTQQSHHERQKYIDQGTVAPSTDVMPAALSAIQLQQERQFLCSHPRSAADPVPVTLLEPIFAEFVDNCQKRQLTADDNRFAWELSERMCLFYESETSWMSVFREVLCEMDIDLESYDRWSFDVILQDKS